MTSETLVRVEDVSKRYCRDLKRSLWYGMQDLGRELAGRDHGGANLRKDEFWAIKDASFALQRGETLGLIGHNGAGKTTMLRMLNGLIRPDAGRIEVNGRIQALIALGAGFNPVLTGRENIFINAAVLGMPKAETARRFDAIVDFSGIEEFIDMPVQNYSSGMTVRLGFAVAANLEPDILLVDEVLAVGDLAFRTKCQVRIQEMRDTGVAIIFVSHNLHTVSHICTRALTLDRGHIIFEGDPESAIDAYRSSVASRNESVAQEMRAGTGEIRVGRLELLDAAGAPAVNVKVGDALTFRLHYEAAEPVTDPVFNLAIHVVNGQQVTGIRTDADDYRIGRVEGRGFIDVIVPNFNLLPNAYTIDAVIFHRDGFTFYDRVNQIASIEVGGGLQINGTAYLPHRWVEPVPTTLEIPALTPAELETS